MNRLYRFYAYNNCWWPDKYLWIQGEAGPAYNLMSSANFIDTLLDMLMPNPFDEETSRQISKTETLSVDMDRLLRTNQDLGLKTIRIISDFDDTVLHPTKIEEWLQELEDWCRAKIISM